MAFVSAPNMNFHVESAFGDAGRPFRQLVPLIETQFRRIINRKHVLPAYKLRYRPLFVNAHMQPTARAKDYAHIRVGGYLTVTVCETADLNYERLARAHADYRVMCTVTIGLFYDLRNASFTIASYLKTPIRLRCRQAVELYSVWPSQWRAIRLTKQLIWCCRVQLVVHRCCA
jgi:hypothetical protein